jgi:ABC-type microcin C transport system permease subunit YejB
MKRIVLTFGLISGAIMSVLMLSTVPFMHKIGFNRGMVLGYTTMVLAFLLVFFGIRSYRENVGNGYISFGRALGVGLLIMLITCAFYVITWEFVYFNFMPDFAEKYGAFMLDNMRAAGASAQEIAAKAEEMKRFKVLYDNIFFNVAMTFLEPLPVGLIMTFVSAAILRKRRQGQQDGVKTTLVHQENPVNPV